MVHLANPAKRFCSIPGRGQSRFSCLIAGGEYSYRFPNFLEFIGERGTHKDHQAIACIQEFVDYIRSGPLAPAWMFLDERMDSVLTHAQDGTYELAMKSKENMQDFIDYQTYLEDMYSNMDFPF